MALLMKDGTISILNADDGHRYVVCDEMVEGSIDHCGELIDVTNRGIKMTMNCGKPENHTIHGKGVDSIVVGF